MSEAPAPLQAADPGSLLHLLRRFTFGPRPGEVEKVQAMGGAAWLDQQLAPADLPDPAGEKAFAPFAEATVPAAQLFGDVDQMLGAEGMMDGPAQAGQNRNMLINELSGRLQMSAIARHIASERQVFEVMVDFWTNHFNVFARKGPAGFAIGDFVEQAIRPHALGQFEDLLLATARHAAMLIYLDNVQSVAPNLPASVALRAPVGLPQGEPPLHPPKRARGLNENYARELMELHTLGVDGGYTQKDVVEVARILTGWSVAAPGKGDFTFVFRPRMHDYGDKLVLGRKFAAGGEEEGRALLSFLAGHPATARHLARKLCIRFVSDDPPPALVKSVAAAYASSNGSIAAMLRAIAASREFAASAGAKVKTPLRFVASAVRAVNGILGGDGLARLLGRLGQPLFLDPVPTGYSDLSRPWLTSAAILDRLNFAVGLSQGRIDGVAFDVEPLVPVALAFDPPRLVSRVEEVLLGGPASEKTRALVTAEVAAIMGGEARRSAALALMLGSPDFQRC